jgi:hypothetical protein
MLLYQINADECTSMVVKLHFIRTLYHSDMFQPLRWVHTCNVTAYRNVVTLQVTDTIRSYELNLHPVPYGVTVSCERYTLGFPVCYGSPSDVFAASSGFVHLYMLRFTEKREKGCGGDVSRCTSTSAPAVTVSYL